jgi:hypothetical protein
MRPASPADPTTPASPAYLANLANLANLAGPIDCMPYSECEILYTAKTCAGASL